MAAGLSKELDSGNEESRPLISLMNSWAASPSIPSSEESSIPGFRRLRPPCAEERNVH